jgi:alkanesulfonate monooxygenase SsuD/methylene tetrahydromethanopterin reductase-like flavin-dependent oxidoreductase (luciferase family)
VADYRAFKVGPDGHFVGFEPITCDTDDEAIERAKRLLDAYVIEIWCGERLVGTLKPE